MLGFLRYLPLSVLHGLAACASYIAYHCRLSIYRSIQANLILVHPQMPDTQRQKLAKQILKNQLISATDSLKTWAMPPKWSIAQIKTVHREDILTKALANPNGMLAIVPHIGTWEIMNAWLNTFGSPTIM